MTPYELIAEYLDSIKIGNKDNDLKSPILHNGIGLGNVYKNLFLVWELDINTGGFRQLVGQCDYSKVKFMNLKGLVESIHPCTQDVFAKVFIEYCNLLLSKGLHQNDKKSVLQFFLPISLEFGQESVYSIMYICPGFGQGKNISRLYVTIIPLDNYIGQQLSFNILRGNIADQELNYKIKEKTKIHRKISEILTEHQLEVYEFISIGFNSRQIASKLNTTKNNILKLNIRIKDRLSGFFGIDFKSVQEAVSYFNRCFSI